MPKNVGTIDRALRAIAGLILIAVAVLNPAMWWAWIGVVPLVTAAIGFCPAYTLIGLKTCPVEDKTA